MDLIFDTQDKEVAFIVLNGTASFAAEGITFQNVGKDAVSLRGKQRALCTCPAIGL